MTQPFLAHLSASLQQLRDTGLYKEERLIAGPQQVQITANKQPVINLCANNYLGLANHPDIRKAAHEALDTFGYGMASVRFICGTQTIHKALEDQISALLGTEDTILYSSCFDANTGLFETILTEEDAIISDALNHASIIDGIRLCKAKRFRYANNDMQALEAQLQAAQPARFRLIATDGVFSMDGTYANLPAIHALAKKYDAMVMVDDSHAVGFVGKQGRGTHEFWGLTNGEIDIFTGTLGKALGGASGGYVSGKKPIIEWLRQRSRPYLFSNSLCPIITATSLVVLDLIKQHPNWISTLDDNSQYFRKHMTEAGFELIPGHHAIIPVMIGDAKKATEMANALLSEGVYVVGFSFPVVPENKARIRTQMSAALTKTQLDIAITAFIKVGKKLGVIT
ncbi:MAG: 2-amino-3-ketobutyrate coenzyme ligase [Pseudomonadota bacterium]|jgi:glycine C-acetyltransferase